jgi:hypothetical protein
MPQTIASAIISHSGSQNTSTAPDLTYSHSYATTCIQYHIRIKHTFDFLRVRNSGNCNITMSCELSPWAAAISTMLTAFIGSVFNGLFSGFWIEFFTGWLSWLSVIRILAAGYYEFYLAIRSGETNLGMRRAWGISGYWDDHTTHYNRRHNPARPSSSSSSSSSSSPRNHLIPSSPAKSKI